MILADTHIHLHFPQFDADRAEVIARAIHCGVGYFLNVGTDLENSRRAVEIAEQYAGVYAAIGFHPHESKHASDADLAALEKLIRHPKVVAIGEVGLDYYHEHSPREAQVKVLKDFLCWYEQHGKPLIIHCRDAYEDLLGILRDFRKYPYHGTLHCYSSDAATMKKYLELGFHIAFGGALTYKKNDSLREACALCPKERLLLETDAPYLPPQTKRGQRNEPLYMTETALHGLSLEEIAELTTANARSLFGFN